MLLKSAQRVYTPKKANFFTTYSDKNDKVIKAKMKTDNR